MPALSLRVPDTPAVRSRSRLASRAVVKLRLERQAPRDPARTDVRARARCHQIVVTRLPTKMRPVEKNSSGAPIHRLLELPGRHTRIQSFSWSC